MLKIYYTSIVIFTIILTAASFLYIALVGNPKISEKKTNNAKEFIRFLFSIFIFSCVPIMRTIFFISVVFATIDKIIKDAKN